MNNIVSKILIVANLVFSLCFMCFAGAVFTFQAGWRDKANKTQTQLASANAQVADLQGQKDLLTTKHAKDLGDETTRANNAEAKINGLDQDRGNRRLATWPTRKKNATTSGRSAGCPEGNAGPHH